MPTSPGPPKQRCKICAETQVYTSSESVGL